MLSLTTWAIERRASSPSLDGIILSVVGAVDTGRVGMHFRRTLSGWKNGLRELMQFIMDR